MLVSDVQHRSAINVPLSCVILTKCKRNLAKLMFPCYIRCHNWDTWSRNRSRGFICDPLLSTILMTGTINVRVRDILTVMMTSQVNVRWCTDRWTDGPFTWQLFRYFFCLVQIFLILFGYIELTFYLMFWKYIKVKY